MREERRITRAKLGQAARTAKKSGKTADAIHRDSLSAEYRALKLEDHIREVVDGWPPLSPEQRDRLAILLRGGGAA